MRLLVVVLAAAAAALPPEPAAAAPLPLPDAIHVQLFRNASFAVQLATGVTVRGGAGALHYGGAGHALHNGTLCAAGPVYNETTATQHALVLNLTACHSCVFCAEEEEGRRRRRKKKNEKVKEKEEGGGRRNR